MKTEIIHLKWYYDKFIRFSPQKTEIVHPKQHFDKIFRFSDGESKIFIRPS